MKPTLTKQILLLLWTGFFIYASSLTMPGIIEMQEREGISVNPVKEGVPPQVAMATAALGGFRGIFIDLLWLRAIKLKEEGNFYEMIQVYDWITNLQPNYSMVWRFVAWDLAYNVSVEHPDVNERWFWVYRGMRYLRDKGIPYNKRDPELYSELAWILHHKIGGQLDFALVNYRTELAKIMDNALEGPCDKEMLEKIIALPEKLDDIKKITEVTELDEALSKLGVNVYDDIIKLRRTPDQYSSEIQGILKQPYAVKALSDIWHHVVGYRLRTQFKMDPKKMLEINEKYGPLDWRGCDALSLYWAYLAREVATQNRELAMAEKPDQPILDLKYERMIYYNLAELVRRGKIMFTSEGLVYNLPDYRFLESARLTMKNLLDRGDVSLSPSGNKPTMSGAKSGYSSFLKDAIFLYYFNGQLESAGRFLKELARLWPEDTKKYDVSLEQYIQNNIEEKVMGMGMKDYASITEGYLRQMYLNIALGDMDAARIQQDMITKMHEYAIRRWDQQKDTDEKFENVVMPLEDINMDLLSSIMVGMDPLFTPTMVKKLMNALPEATVEEAKENAKKKIEAIQERRRQQAQQQNPKGVL